MSIIFAIVYTIPFFLLSEIFKQVGIDLKDYGIVWIIFLAFGWGFYQGRFVSFSSFNHGTGIFGPRISIHGK